MHSTEILISSLEGKDLSLKTVRFPDDAKTYLIPRVDQIQLLIFHLAQVIKEEEKEREIEIDRIMTLSENGLALAPTLADLLNIRRRTVPFEVTHFPDAGIRELISFSLPIGLSLKGEGVLFFAEVNRNEDFLSRGWRCLNSCEVRPSKSAVLFHHPESEFEPNYSMVTTDYRVISPLRICKAITRLSLVEWRGLDLSCAQLKARFSLMFKDAISDYEAQVDFCLNHVRKIRCESSGCGCQGLAGSR